ncbi:MAG: S9 family peptidase [Candidatus Xenobia bacterium]
MEESSPSTAPFGSWRSPITADMVVAGAMKFDEVEVDGDSIYWLERRPASGAAVIVRWTPGARMVDLTPDGYSARRRVHEYGGGAFTVQDDEVFFVNDRDQGIYHLQNGHEPALVAGMSGLRYADLRVDVERRRLIAVREDHTAGGEPINSLVEIDLENGGPGEILVSGHDFYSSPVLSPDGRMLAWLSWNHPNMPWDGTELWWANIGANGGLEKPSRVAGGPEESIFQPAFSPDGVLHFLSDRNGWWNLYRMQHGQVVSLLEQEADFGRPQWVFGMATYGFLRNGSVVCMWYEDGRWQLGNLNEHALTPIDSPFTDFRYIRTAHDFVVFVGDQPDRPAGLVRLHGESGVWEVLRRSAELQVDDAFLSLPTAITFDTTDGDRSHGLYYPPHNTHFQGPDGDAPPLLVKSHGGPTSCAPAAFDLELQYWTSRGFAVLDVNYRGSTGYGRAYREKLRGRWGVVDVDDCVYGARHLANLGLVDETRLAIEGGSAGGYTTLAALTFREAFRVGASFYGVSDLTALARDTHKFESRYLDSLVGPWPQAEELYHARSPIYHVDRLSTPVIFLQGSEDKVVPPDQAEKCFEALRQKGVPTALIIFEGEQHGFRKADSMRRALEATFYFFSRVLGFTPADPMPPIPLENESALKA